MAERARAKRLTPARERVLRAVAADQVWCDTTRVKLDCWIARKVGRFETCTSQVKALFADGLITHDTEPRLYRAPVTLTPAGREWLDSNPEKEES